MDPTNHLSMGRIDCRQPKLFFDKTVYSFLAIRCGNGLIVQMHIDDPTDDIKTIDVEAKILIGMQLISDQQLVIICLEANGIDPNIYETKLF